MLRNRAIALALTLLLPPAVFALGLGALKTSSSLNQRFDGRIDVLGATNEDLDTLNARLADAQQFERAGIQRDAVLLDLKFELVSTESGKDYVHITSKEPIREPFLNFLLELNWSKGRVLREYTVLLDPPLYDASRRAASAARGSAPARSAAPLGGIPPSMVQVAAAPSRASDAASGGSIGPVEANDTLWSLSMQYRPDAAVSVHQMMIALLRANPEAFANGNINLLKRGAVLRIPTNDEINQVSRNVALAEIRKQHQIWEDYRHGASTHAAAQPLGTGKEGTAAAKKAPPPATTTPADGHLELAAPGTAEEKGAAEGAAGKGAGTETAGKEDLDARARENVELKNKLSEADKIIDLLQRQVEIKDQELATLQARMATTGLAHGEAGATAATAARPPAEPAAPPGPTVAPTPAPSSAPAPEKAAEPPPAAGQALPAAAEAPKPEPIKPEVRKPERPGSEAMPPAPTAKPTPKAAVAPGLLERLFPTQLVHAVPGGTTTLLAAMGLVLALAAVATVKSLSRRAGEKPMPSPKRTAAVAAAAAGAAAGTSVALAETQQPAEPVMETRAPGKAVEEQLPTPGAFERTLEATADQLRAEPIEDPLEEVNVYLAYERFDQAEELVKKVIAQYPNEHKYKLRLLEIYYSANDKRAYEDAARDLLNAVGDKDPLWENAVAMWTEMSPERPLFAVGAVEEAPEGVSKTFVDITGDTVPGAETMTMQPGRDTLEATQVGLGEAPVQGLDFDLSDTGSGPQLGMLDLTAAEAGEASTAGEFFDPTLGAGEPGEALDLSAAAGESAAGTAEEGVFDISGESLSAADLTALDSAPAHLLDVTSTGNLTLEGADDLLSLTAPGLSDRPSTQPSHVQTETLDLSAPAAAAVDFDLSDTVHPPTTPDAIVEDTPPKDVDEVLDFDIEGLGFGAAEGTARDGGGLDLGLEGDEAVVDLSGASAALDLDLGGGQVADLDLTTEGGPDFDLSLQNPELEDFELIVDDATTPASNEADIEFDLALQDTTDFDNLRVDDTLELPKTSSAFGSMTAGENVEESLEDLTRSMEESMAALDLEDEGKESAFELDIAPLDANAENALDLEIDDAHLGTLGLEPDDIAFDATTSRIEPTANASSDDVFETQDDADEIDTKLNLAKAYLELGDREGARSILDEVARDGTDAQRAEAQTLLMQAG